MNILGKLAKITPELGNAEKFITTAKTFSDLLNRGLNKLTAPNFYVALEVCSCTCYVDPVLIVVLQTLSAHIGEEGFNNLSIWRIFEYAFLKKHMFSPIPAHLDSISLSSFTSCHSFIMH